MSGILLTLDAQIITLITQLTEASQRRESSVRLAEYLGGQDLIIFTRDSEIALPLPAPGFPRTLPEGRLWRAFLGECAAAGHLRGSLPFPGCAGIQPVTGIVAQDGSILVVAGESASLERLQGVTLLLPLLAAAFQAERQALIAAGHAAAARDSAVQASALASNLDATRRELQQALATAQAALGTRDEFLSIAAHELKTPLTALLGSAQLLIRRAATGTPLGPMVVRQIQTIEFQSKRLSRLVELLFDVSRLKSGRLTITRETLDICSVAEKLLTTLEPLAARHTLSMECADGPLMISADRLRIEQVIFNLVENALKYSPVGGTVSIALEHSRGEACLSVIDSGIGIPQAAQSHLFEQFYRAPNADSAQISGMGIGLFVVKQIVDLHGGSIEIQSDEGKGSRFTVRLPLVSDAIEQAGDASVDLPASS